MREAGEVGAGVGLAEQLAPDLVGPQHRRHVAALLGLGAVLQHDRHAHTEGDGEHAGGQVVAGGLLLQHLLVGPAEALPAVWAGW